MKQRRQRTKRAATPQNGGEPKPKAASAPKSWVVSGDPSVVLPPELGSALHELGVMFGAPVWTLIHNEESAFMDYGVLTAFLNARDSLRPDQCVLLVIDSPGGYADVAYRIARIFSRHAGGFIAVIPRLAKSAATLLTLGASKVVMAPDAEIGPLDAQIYDPEREQPGSALDEIQALEHLHRVALAQLNQNLVLMRQITRRRFDIVMPHATKLVSDMMAPLLDKIDTVHYAKQSRLLAVAEEYATRLMAPHRDQEEARRVAKRLVRRYPEHGFVIDRREAASMLDLLSHSDEVDHILRKMENVLWTQTVKAFGSLKEAA